MLDRLLLPTIGSRPWIRPALAAVFLHLALLLGAIGSAGMSPATLDSAVRDTIRLEIGQLAAPERQHDGPVMPPNPAIPLPPPVPDVALDAPRFELPRPSFAPADLAALSRTPLPRSSGESSAAPHRLTAVFAVTEVEQPPELARDLYPRYPEALRRSGVSGEVQLEYVIQSSGRVDRESIRVLASAHPSFSEAAIEAVRGARFKPALRAGRPVAVRVRQTIKFLNW